MGTPRRGAERGRARVCPGHGPAGPPVADIVVEDGFVTARLLRADAEPADYRAEFAEYGVDARIVFEPVSPGMVGELVHLDTDAGTESLEEGGGIEVEEPLGECSIEDGCPAVVRIPVGHPTPVVIGFGREARPDEPYSMSQAANAPGEPLEGVALEGVTVGEIRTVLVERGLDVGFYIASPPEGAEGYGENEMAVLSEGEVGDDRIVADVILESPGGVYIELEP
ncbi:hypothetical protein [Nocardiopsis lambiniae]|uniref:PASTA domain-containing protein n=1 Tax=Nocardiopsis lambiniae TaxID=3075539 RepID=A0ABU2M9U6_9ACTN|nr:hypothetical protein [Nocardiopsis sp. DSM 44743]MDT0328746.1 hypothetical protein [Nocardiopsis sp. DSM 44743]